MTEINPNHSNDARDDPRHLATSVGASRPIVYHDMIAGFGAGFVATAVGFPLDVIKTRLQTGQAKKSAMKMGRKIVRKEGVNGLYKGLASPLLTLSLTSSICFSSFQVLKEVYKAGPGFHHGNLLAGMNCGLATGVISTMENHVRTLMQTDKEQRFRSSFHCMSSIVRNYGFRTLFTGWGITTAKDCFYYGSYFFVYEGMKETLGGSTAAIPLAGGAAGVSAWIVAYPFDIVRAGRQGQSIQDGITPSSREVVKDLLERRGIRGLFAGISPALTRAVVVHSLRFSAYEGLLWLFRNINQEERAPSSRPSVQLPSYLKALTGSKTSNS